MTRPRTERSTLLEIAALENVIRNVIIERVTMSCRGLVTEPKLRHLFPVSGALEACDASASMGSLYVLRFALT